MRRAGGDRPAKPGSPADWLTPADRQRLVRKSLPAALGILAIHGALYLLTLGLAVIPSVLWLNIIAAIVNGILIAMLFVIGHDASHSSYLPGRRGNQIIARLAFLPSLHSASLWDVVHNRIHHGKTNLKGFDYVWAPMSKAEYDCAGRFRQLRERVYRSAFGPLIYYYCEFWPFRVLLPTAREARASWRAHLPDTLLVLAGFGGIVGSILWMGHEFHSEAPWWRLLLLGWVIPFATFNYILALSIYVQHTHPRVPWFDDEATWSSYGGNIRGTTHVELPINIAPLWSMVLEHTAHHAMTSIPIYNLRQAQANLLERYGEEVVRYMLTPASYMAITRACKLYDFKRACWTDFDGVPTYVVLDECGAPSIERGSGPIR